jgi:hypothetical protein
MPKTLRFGNRFPRVAFLEHDELSGSPGARFAASLLTGGVIL